MLSKNWANLFLIFCCCLFCYQQFSEQKEPLITEQNEAPMSSSSELEFIRPYMGHLPPDYLTVPEYNLTACTYRKSMSQMTTNAMCLLYDPQRFLSENHSFNETWKSKRSCKAADKNGFGGFPENLQNTSRYTRFVFIRDPFDRFISFYLDKCLHEKRCYNCEPEDLRCVVKEVYDSLLKISRGEQALLTKMLNSSSYMDIHATPTTWVCDFQQFRNVYYIMVIGSSFDERKEPIAKFVEILRRKNVPEVYISKIEGNLLTSETHHSTHNSEMRKIAEEKVKNDKIIREYLHKIYFYDYLVFPEFDRAHLDAPYNMSNSSFDEKYRKDYESLIKSQEFLSKLKN
ncbi:unnamed protein product [Caenorhabditis angaria]|uniref:Sulfotransferase domain-containing protein n=1 Tax=Caenorhabditis angaria TaxID=860376 RepID=A0A9P1IS77_9PELO|nr:unnamed protein product [Caenorhabditis angaria]